MLPYMGWDYAYKYDRKYFSNIITKEKEKL